MTWKKLTCPGDIKNKMDGLKLKSHKVHTFCQYNLRQYIDSTGSGSGQWGKFPAHAVNTGFGSFGVLSTEGVFSQMFVTFRLKRVQV